MRFFAIARTVFSFMLVATLTACAVAPTDSPLTDDHTFHRSGRFALNVEMNNGKQDAVQGGFRWQEKDQHLQLDLNNPMGTTLAQVVVSEQGAALHYPNGSTEYAASADALVEQLFGYAIPVEGMRSWLRGETGSAPAAHQQYDSDTNQLSYFEQNQWRVNLKRYDEHGPQLLQMYRNQAQQKISVRVVVDY